MYNCCFYLYISNFVASASLLFLYICDFCLNLLFIHLHITVFCVLSLMSISFLDAFFCIFLLLLAICFVRDACRNCSYAGEDCSLCSKNQFTHTHTHSHTSCHQDWTDDYRQTFILITWCKNEDVLIVIWNNLEWIEIKKSLPNDVIEHLYLPCLPPSRPISRTLSVRRVRYSQYNPFVFCHFLVINRLETHFFT